MALKYLISTKQNNHLQIVLFLFNAFRHRFTDFQSQMNATKMNQSENGFICKRNFAAGVPNHTGRGRHCVLRAAFRFIEVI